MKGEVTVRSSALMRTGPAQLDDRPQAISADEREARNITPTRVRLVVSFSISRKLIFDNCSIVTS